MDILNQILATLELSGGIFARCEYHGEWTLDMSSEDAYMLFHVVQTGSALFQYLGMNHSATPIHLQQGDVIVLPFGDRHRLWYGPAPQTDATMTLQQQDLQNFKTVRPVGNGAKTALLCGYYRFEQFIRHPLLRLLPRVLHIQAGHDAQQTNHLVALIDREAKALQPGSQAIMDRLAEALFLYLLRAWTQQQDTPNGLLAALIDPVLGPALQALHKQPEKPWTVAELGHVAGASRAKFAKRFQQLLDCGPIHYLTEIRMTQAITLLRENKLPLSIVAERVGYDSEAAFAKVFKKITGQPPGRFRKLEQSKYS